MKPKNTESEFSQIFPRFKTISGLWFLGFVNIALNPVTGILDL